MCIRDRAQIDALWAVKDEPWVNTVLIYIYTGFRLQELLTMKTDQVNLEEWYFQGGLKMCIRDSLDRPLRQQIIIKTFTFLSDPVYTLFGLLPEITGSLPERERKICLLYTSRSNNQYTLPVAAGSPDHYKPAYLEFYLPVLNKLLDYSPMVFYWSPQYLSLIHI